MTYSTQLDTGNSLHSDIALFSLRREQRTQDRVACSTVSSDMGLTPTGGLGQLKMLQTNTPPSGPPGSASDIRFKPSSSALFGKTKGNPGPPAVPGYIYAFAINNGHIFSHPIISPSLGLIVDWIF